MSYQVQREWTLAEGHDLPVTTQVQKLRISTRNPTPGPSWAEIQKAKTEGQRSILQYSYSYSFLDLEARGQESSTR